MCWAEEKAARQLGFKDAVVMPARWSNLFKCMGVRVWQYSLCVHAGQGVDNATVPLILTCTSGSR
jgi:hypothetical protein